VELAIRFGLSKQASQPSWLATPASPTWKTPFGFANRGQSNCEAFVATPSRNIS